MQEELKYPIGIQTFSSLIEEGYAYVDKSRFIPALLKAGKYLFLSRPRRFGKSLLLSMLHSYFAGERDLFQGLEIDRMNVDWSPKPVVHIDFNPQNYSLDGALDRRIDAILESYEKEYSILAPKQDPSIRFEALLRRIHESTGERVVILVDEYDKPLLEIESDPELFAKNQAILKAFFGVLKSSDRHIHFAMLTGVARFNKVSIFSDLNNLRDISLSDTFADICGWTHGELLATFLPGIKEMAEANDMSVDETIRSIREMYDGYLFAPKGSRLYNPFSVLNALADRRFSYYWYRTGTPTFLVNRIRDSRITLPSLDNCRAYEDRLMSIGFDDPNPIPLLFQTGYLTIKHVEGRMYFLQFPNEEVRVGFAESLQQAYLPQMDNMENQFSVWDFTQELLQGNPENFMLRLQSMIKGIPYEQHHEGFYQNIVYILFTLIGADSRLEEHTNFGRPDLVVRTKEYVYIFEFKYDGTPLEAKDQIKDRDYAGRFGMDPRKIFLIGANFSSSQRGLDSWLIEAMP